MRPRFWSDIPEMRVEIFKKLRSPEGDAMVMETNFFIEKMLFDLGTIRDLSEAEKEVYRKPTEDPEKRMLTLQWAREIPFDGEPEDNFALVKSTAISSVKAAIFPSSLSTARRAMPWPERRGSFARNGRTRPKAAFRAAIMSRRIFRKKSARQPRTS